MTVRGPSGTALKLSLGRLRAASPERGALRTPPTEAGLERSAVSGEGDRSRRPAPASLDQGGPIGDEPIRPPRWEQSAEAGSCAPAATAPSAWLKTFQRAAVRRLRRTGRGGSFSVGGADPDGGYRAHPQKSGRSVGNGGGGASLWVGRCGSGLFRRRAPCAAARSAAALRESRF